MIRKNEKIRTRDDEDYISNEEYWVWLSRCKKNNSFFMIFYLIEIPIRGNMNLKERI